MELFVKILRQVQDFLRNIQDDPFLMVAYLEETANDTIIDQLRIFELLTNLQCYIDGSD